VQPVIFDKATWRGPTSNKYTGGMGKVMGLVVHIAVSGPNGSQPGQVAVDAGEGIVEYFLSPASQVSAHFVTGTKGELFQVVDTADAAWAQVAGNANWISVEDAGNCGDTLLASQVESVAQLLAWLHATHGVPLQLTESPATPGLGYHAMGGASWGNHPCPCPPIITESRPLVLARAIQIVNGGANDVQLPAYKIGQQGVGVCSLQGALNAHVRSGRIKGVNVIAETGIFDQDTLELLHAWMKVDGYGPYDWWGNESYEKMFPPIP
jgi:hypothetical protein